MNKCLITSCFVLLVGIGLLVGLPLVIHSEISRRMKILNGTTLFKSWSSCRSGMIVEFYFFIVSNTKEFMAGEKPILKEVGPYSYEQVTCKGILQSSPQNGTVLYADRNTFKFLPNQSVGSESDNITVLNIGYVSVANIVGKNAVVDFIVRQFFNIYYRHQLFLTRTVYQMIWGYEDPMLKAINKVYSVQYKIGLYADKNNSIGAHFEINDGALDTSKVGQILTFNGNRNLSVWNTPLANSINGSDGSLFPPFIDTTSPVHVFSSDLCRSLEFQTHEDDKPVYIDSVSTRKFILSNNTFLSPDVCPRNQGFCLDYPNCPKSGVLDMRSCIKGASIAVSLPHFNGADQSYRDAVIGMHPRSDMDISLFIEPQTGVVLQALQLIQINAVVTRNRNFEELANLRNLTYLPLGYINTSIYVSDSVARTLVTTLFIPQMSISVVGSIMVTGSLLTIFVISGIMFASRCRSFQVSFGPRTEENSPLIVECPEESSSERELNSQPSNGNSLSAQVDPATLIAPGEKGNGEALRV
nr:lysosome membrane protein 2 [Hymenolepis microstoma]